MYGEYREDFPGIRELSVEEYGEFVRDRKFVLVDVRETKEREVSVIPGSISAEEFERRREEFADSTVIAHCTIGYRSGKFVKDLQEEGIEAYNLIGSILSWVHAGRPVVDSQGAPTTRVHVYGEKWDLLPEGYEAVW